jgi:TonB family protein
MKTSHSLLLIGLSILTAQWPMLGQEQSAQSSANRQMRIRQSSAVALGRMETEPLPEYPKDALDKHIEGTVIIHLVAGVDGAVKQAEVTSGPPELTKSALDAVKQWRFLKTLLNGQPVEIDTNIALVYALRPTPAVLVDKDYKPTPAFNAPDTSGSVLASKGMIEGGTYKNSAIGLELTVAPGLRLEQMPGMGSHGIAVQAQNGPEPEYGLTVFYADALATYPEDQRNTSRYQEKIVRSNQEGGFQLTEGQPSAEISSIRFARNDFVRGAVHETVLVMTHNGYAFVFIFTGASSERTDKLIASTNLKVTP